MELTASKQSAKGFIDATTRIRLVLVRIERMRVGGDDSWLKTELNGDLSCVVLFMTVLLARVTS